MSNAFFSIILQHFVIVFNIKVACFLGHVSQRIQAFKNRFSFLCYRIHCCLFSKLTKNKVMLFSKKISNL